MSSFPRIVKRKITVYLAPGQQSRDSFYIFKSKFSCKILYDSVWLRTGINSAEINWQIITWLSTEVFLLTKGLGAKLNFIFMRNRIPAYSETEKIYVNQKITGFLSVCVSDNKLIWFSFTVKLFFIDF